MVTLSGACEPQGEDRRGRATRRRLRAEEGLTYKRSCREANEEPTCCMAAVASFRVTPSMLAPSMLTRMSPF